MAPALPLTRSLKAALPVALAFALASCASWGEGVTEGRTPEGAPVPTPSNGLIAYSGLDGNVYTLDPASGQSRFVTEDAEVGRKEYRSAAWDPDGRRLAFVEVLSTGGAATGSRVLVADAVPGRSTAFPVREIAGDAPAYLSWSPDGARIGMLESPQGKEGTWHFVAVPVGRAQGQNAGQVSAQGGARGPSQRARQGGGQGDSRGAGDAERISSGRPLYWDWSGDGKRVVSHIGTSDAKGNITSTTMGEHRWVGDTVSDAAIATRPSSFQSPAVSRSGSSFVMTGYASAESQDRRDSHLLLVSNSGEVLSELMDVEGFTAFGLSPSEELLAFIDGTVSAYGGVIGPLGIVRMKQGPEGLHHLTVLTVEENIVAFFWSPDGRSVVYFRPQESGRGRRRILTVEASVLDARTGESRSVAVFEPSPLFMGELVPRFDQYQRTATIWAPDGSAFAVNVMASGRPAVAIVPVAPDGKPSVVAFGNLPFWSPR